MQKATSYHSFDDNLAWTGTQIIISYSIIKPFFKAQPIWFITNVKSVKNKLTFPLSLRPCYDSFVSRHDSNLLPEDNDILFSRWKTPLRPAYFKPSVHPLSTRVFDSKVHIWSAFFPKPLKEANVNWNLLSLWDVSSLRKWRWMTGNPVGLPPVAPRYCSVAHRWVGWDMKGVIRCWGCFSALVLHELHESFKGFLAGTEQRQKQISHSHPRNTFRPGSHI